MRRLQYSGRISVSSSFTAFFEKTRNAPCTSACRCRSSTQEVTKPQPFESHSGRCGVHFRPDQARSAFRPSVQLDDTRSRPPLTHPPPRQPATASHNMDRMCLPRRRHASALCRHPLSRAIHLKEPSAPILASFVLAPTNRLLP